MKIWYLENNLYHECAVVFAKDEYEAYAKLKERVDIDEEYSQWTIEEFTETTYDGVLYFS